MLAAEAVHLMETHSITSLVVLDADAKVVAHSTCMICCARAYFESAQSHAACEHPAFDLDVDGVLTDGRLYCRQ